jgi:nitrogen regulatory protein PII
MPIRAEDKICIYEVRDTVRIKTKEQGDETV